MLVQSGDAQLARREEDFFLNCTSGTDQKGFVVVVGMFSMRKAENQPTRNKEKQIKS